MEGLEAEEMGSDEPTEGKCGEGNDVRGVQRDVPVGEPIGQPGDTAGIGDPQAWVEGAGRGKEKRDGDSAEAG